MNLELVDKIAKAVLYEGYMLYPYRASTVKNRQRWNFGAVYPEAFAGKSGGTDASFMQTQCLAFCGEAAEIDVSVRFLHLLARQVYELDQNSESSSTRRSVPSLEAGGRLYQTWQEAVEREVGARGLLVSELCAGTKRFSFHFEAVSETEPIRDSEGVTAGEIVRRQESIDGAIEVFAERLADRLFKITVRVLNLTPMNTNDSKSRDKALMRSLVSTHTVLGIRSGEFVSLLETPEAARDWVSACANIGTYPVLIGEAGERDLMLSSPIILYDYPRIAPESAGDLFDATEIDEILTLRILTLTDDEKREMRDLDDHSRRILERTESMPLEQLMKLHGAVRGLRPVRPQDDV